MPTKRQPDVDDLRWEVIRRQQEYQLHFERFKKNPETEGQCCAKWSCKAFSLVRMEDPAVAWDESVEPFYNEPACPVVGVRSAPVTMHWGAPEKGFVYFKVDPTISKRQAKDKIEAMLDHYKESRGIPPATDTVIKHLKWLCFVDKVEEKRSPPTADTIRLVAGSGQSKPETYARGKILLENPFADVTREITRDEAEAYLHDRNLRKARQ